MVLINCSDPNFFLNIFICVQQKKETLTGLEQVWGE